jgi:hypothetical protein
VRLSRVGREGTLEASAALTDRRGRHRFQGLEPGLYHVTVEQQGKAVVTAPPWRCERDDARGTAQLALTDAQAVLEGRVTGYGGAPVAGSELLVAQPEGAQTALAGVAHIVVDDTGRFRARLAPGTYQLLATAPAHTAQMQMVKVGVDEVRGRTRFALEFTPRVSGVVVTEAGEPVRDAVVSVGAAYDPKAGSAAVRTDEEGRFSIGVLAGQALHLSARGEGLLGSVDLEPVTHISGKRGVSIVARAGRAVTGLVQNADGSAKAFPDVAFRVRDQGVTGVVRGDAEGRFVVDGLPLSSDVELWAEGNASGAWGAVVASPADVSVLVTYTAPAF